MLHRMEQLLWIAGAAILVVCAGIWFEARLYQRSQEQILELAIRRPKPPGLPQLPGPPGSLVGRIDIPRIGLSAIVVEGVEPRILRVAAGHVPGTALPGGPGTVAIAAHRDTLFRGLRHIHCGDQIVVTTVGGQYRYSVDSIRVVGPDDVSVLEASPRPSLRLITCYPFYYLGPAPRRFIVQARQV